MRERTGHDIFCFYGKDIPQVQGISLYFCQTRVRSLVMLVSNSLTNSLAFSRLYACWCPNSFLNIKAVKSFPRFETNCVTFLELVKSVKLSDFELNCNFFRNPVENLYLHLYLLEMWISVGAQLKIYICICVIGSLDFCRCPVEDDRLVLGKVRPLITGSENHTAFIKVFVTKENLL